MKIDLKILTFVFPVIVSAAISTPAGAEAFHTSASSTEVIAETVSAFPEQYLPCLSSASVSVSASSAALYEPETGSFIYEKDGRTRRGMASTTKIMTGLVAIENCPLDRHVKIDPRACGTEGSSIYLKPGEELTMEELLYALLLNSANDAAAAIAYEVGGSIEGFAAMMNARAEKLALRDTHFMNPHGLDDKEHYTTACDLAIITAAALKNDCFRTIVSTYKKTIPGSAPGTQRYLVNHNRLLKSFSGSIGVKTGFTRKCGRCLCGAAERDGLRLISVTLNAPDDWNDHKKMLSTGFSMLELRTLADKKDHTYQIPVVNGREQTLTVSIDDDIRAVVEKSSGVSKSEVRLIKYAVAPIAEGEILGEVIIDLGDGRLIRSPLKAEKSIEKTKEKKRFFGLFPF